MKKMLFVLAVSLFLLSSSFAQVKISGGVLAGLNLANASVDPQQTGVDYGTLTGFAFGGVLNFDFTGGFGLKVEPMYIQKGVKLSAGANEAKIKANYIDIPAMFVYTFATGAGQVEPYLMAGPSFGILLSATQSFNGNDTDIKSTTSSTDFGATFGGGAKFPVGKNRVFVEARYSLSFSNANNDANNPGASIKNKGIEIFAGFTFPFGS